MVLRLLSSLRRLVQDVMRCSGHGHWRGGGDCHLPLALPKRTVFVSQDQTSLSRPTDGYRMAQNGNEDPLL